MEDGDDAASRGLSALDSSVSGLSGLARVPVMGFQQEGADSLRGSAGGGSNNARPQRPPQRDVNPANGGIDTDGGNGAARGNGTAVDDDDGGGMGTAFDDDDDGDGIGNADHGNPPAGNEAMDASPRITPGVPFDGLNEEEFPECEGCDPPSWMLLRKEVWYRYRMMLDRGTTIAVVLCSRRQDPIPWSHLDIDGLLIEGPTDMLLTLLSPMAVDLCHYTHQPDWQRGNGNWTGVVSGTRDPNKAGHTDTATAYSRIPSS